jgi:hypothetical protein
MLELKIVRETNYSKGEQYEEDSDIHWKRRDGKEYSLSGTCETFSTRRKEDTAGEYRYGTQPE